jgi:hypothetical protein
VVLGSWCAATPDAWSLQVTDGEPKKRRGAPGTRDHVRTKHKHNGPRTDSVFDASRLASRYPAIEAVVGVVPGHAVFPAHTIAMNTSSFSSNGEALAFVPVPWSAVPALIKRDLRGAWEEMLEDREAVEKAAIPVEQINGPIFLLSATRDEFWPSTEMSESMIQRLKEHSFPYRYEHVAGQRWP